jgi:hypothetical protein
MSIKNFVPKKSQKYLKLLNTLMKEEQGGVEDLFSLATNLSRYLSYGELARILVRYELFKLVKNQSGDILEFGIFMGTGIVNFLSLGELLEPHNYNRRIIGFDTFDGLKGEKSDFRELEPGMYKYKNKRHLEKIVTAKERNKLRPSKNVILIEGDVTDTLPKFILNEPSFLPTLIFLDLDLYGPTKFVLENLIPFLRPGCVIAFDELGMRKFSGETRAFFDTEIAKMGELQKFDFAKVSYIQI